MLHAHGWQHRLYCLPGALPATRAWLLAARFGLLPAEAMHPCPHAGQLRVLVTHDDPPATRYTLFTNGGGRFTLRVSADTSEWRTGMQLRVVGHQLNVTADPLLPSISPTPELAVTRVLQVAASTSTGATANDMVGTSPSTMRVLFIIITMCGRTASISPTVSARCDLSNRVL
jgi:hypothetical protein